MNRRRIGLAALVVGAGVLVRRRLQARVDAGQDSNEPAATESGRSEPSVGDAPSGAQPSAVDSAGDGVVAESAVIEPAAGVEPVVAESDVDPDGHAPSAAGQAESGSDESAAPDGVAESAVIEPAAGVEPVIAAPVGTEVTPNATASAAEPAPLPPRIVLPSMPTAGTNTVVQPLTPNDASNTFPETDQSGPSNHAN